MGHVDTTGDHQERAWVSYREWLASELDQKIFSGEVSLREVYVPLRAYWEDVRHSKDRVFVERQVHEVHTEMRRWATSAAIRNPLRIICGGPGYGKSSFAKAFCEEINEDDSGAGADTKALYIPLQRVELGSGENAVEQINAYLNTYRFDFCDPFNPGAGVSLLLVLDGLDELAMQGDDAKKAAIKFVNDVGTAMQPVNKTSVRLRCLVCGRDIMVQAVADELQLDDQIWHLVPYLWREEEHARSYRPSGDPSGATIRAEYDYGRSLGLLAEDQRPLWWQNYGRATGRNYDDIPLPLRTENLAPLTSLPLLNYLLALSYEHNSGMFGENTTRNDIYYDLLRRIHERDWAESGSNPRNVHTRGMNLSAFVRVLEEVALAAWHSGDTRTALVEDIEEACDRAGLLSAWRQFESRGKEGLTRILTAFYVRWREFGAGVVEFTHKSFGDYLAARAIVNAWETVAGKFGKGGHSVECLLDWLRTCGPSGIDVYILDFVRDEVASRRKSAARWQESAARLLQHTVDHGIQTEVSERSFSSQESQRQTRNATEALLSIHSSCGAVTGKASPLTWRHPRRAYLWLVFLQGEDFSANVTNQSLNHLEFRGDAPRLYARGLNLTFAILDGAAFHRVDFSGAVLRGASLRATHWESATLDGADLSGADLRDAEVWSSSLRYATLTKAKLHHADLEGAILFGATLENAEMEKIRLSKANMQNADLRGAKLREARLDEADLNGATLAHADLADADCRDARMQGADASGANLSGTNLESADLSFCDLTDTALLHANLNWTKFEGATMERVRLEGARLAGAYLAGVDLRNVEDAAKAHWNGAQMNVDTRLPPDFPYHAYKREPHELIPGVFVLRRSENQSKNGKE